MHGGHGGYVVEEDAEKEETALQKKVSESITSMLSLLLRLRNVHAIPNAMATEQREELAATFSCMQSLIDEHSEEPLLRAVSCDNFDMREIIQKAKKLPVKRQRELLYILGQQHHNLKTPNLICSCVRELRVTFPHPFACALGDDPVSQRASHFFPFVANKAKENGGAGLFFHLGHHSYSPFELFLAAADKGSKQQEWADPTVSGAAELNLKLTKNSGARPASSLLGRPAGHPTAANTDNNVASGSSILDPVNDIPVRCDYINFRLKRKLTFSLQVRIASTYCPSSARAIRPSQLSCMHRFYVRTPGFLHRCPSGRT